MNNITALYATPQYNKMELNGCHKFFMKLVEASANDAPKIEFNMKTVPIDLPLDNKKQFDITLIQFQNALYTCSQNEISQANTITATLQTKYKIKEHKEYSQFKWDTIQFIKPPPKGMSHGGAYSN